MFDYLESRRSVNVAQHGAVGDWDGTVGTDNRAQFNAALNEAVAGGRGKLVISEPGDYWLSNDWLLDAESLVVECDPGVTIRTTSATTTGAAVTFMGNGILSPNDVSTPQRKLFAWHGGRISASGSGTADNALGVVRVKNNHISDVFLDADRKGLTSQYGIDNIVWERFVVERAGVDAVAAETATHRAVLRDGHIVSAGKVGVIVTSAFTDQRNSDVLIDNVHVDASETGYSLGLTDRISLNKVTSSNATLRDLYVAEVTDLSISGDSRLAVVTYGSNVTHKKPRRVDLGLSNGWVAYRAPMATPHARRTSDGEVVLDGSVKSGTLTAGMLIATLPVGFRPIERQPVVALSAGGSTNAAYLYVEPVGAATPGGIFAGAAIPSSVLLSFSNIKFFAS